MDDHSSRNYRIFKSRILISCDTHQPKHRARSDPVPMGMSCHRVPTSIEIFCKNKVQTTSHNSKNLQINVEEWHWNVRTYVHENLSERWPDCMKIELQYPEGRPRPRITFTRLHRHSILKETIEHLRNNSTWWATHMKTIASFLYVLQLTLYIDTTASQNDARVISCDAREVGIFGKTSCKVPSPPTATTAAAPFRTACLRQYDDAEIWSTSMSMRSSRLYCQCKITQWLALTDISEKIGEECRECAPPLQFQLHV